MTNADMTVQGRFLFRPLPGGVLDDCADTTSGLRASDDLLSIHFLDGMSIVDAICGPSSRLACRTNVLTTVVVNENFPMPSLTNGMLFMRNVHIGYLTRPLTGIHHE